MLSTSVRTHPQGNGFPLMYLCKSAWRMSQLPWELNQRSQKAQPLTWAHGCRGQACSERVGEGKAGLLQQDVSL